MFFRPSFKIIQYTACLQGNRKRLWNMNVISTKTQLSLVYDKGVNNPLIWHQGTCLTNQLCISGP